MPAAKCGFDWSPPTVLSSPNATANLNPMPIPIPIPKLGSKILTLSVTCCRPLQATNYGRGVGGDFCQTDKLLVMVHHTDKH